MMETDDLLTAHPVLPEESLWDTRKWATVLHVAQAILDALPMATMMLDVEWRVVLVNRKLEELFEVSEKRIVGAPLSKLLPHKEVAEIMSRGQQERGPQEVELTLTPPRAQGRIFRAVIADVELGIKEN
jgi:PAS domain S-box-containing protein